MDHPGHHPIGDRSNGVLCVGGAKDGVAPVLRGAKGDLLHPWMDIFQEDFAAIFGKMLQHHRTECDLSAGQFKKFCTSFNMENLPLTLGLCISVGFLWCFSTFLESLESLFTGIDTAEGFAKFWGGMIKEDVSVHLLSIHSKPRQKQVLVRIFVF